MYKDESQPAAHTEEEEAGGKWLQVSEEDNSITLPLLLQATPGEEREYLCP